MVSSVMRLNVRKAAPTKLVLILNSVRIITFPKQNMQIFYASVQDFKKSNNLLSTFFPHVLLCLCVNKFHALYRMWRSSARRSMKKKSLCKCNFTASKEQ